MDFDSYIDEAWARHADDPEAVAAELAPIGLPLVASPAQATRLAHLAHHVHGEHLGLWTEGQVFQQQLTALPCLQADDASDVKEAVSTLRCHAASLRLSSGDAGAIDALPASDRVRALALAAGNLAVRDSARTAQLFAQARAEAAPLPEDGRHTRALAVAGNGLACAYEAKPDRNADERTLMILAAETARRCWAIAGSWLQVERADYRLAMTWLHAGDPATARRHAQACLDRVQAHGNVPLELFFAWEALARAEHAVGDAAARTHAAAQAQAAFEALDEEDRGGVRPSLDGLMALPRG